MVWFLLNRSFIAQWYGIMLVETNRLHTSFSLLVSVRIEKVCHYCLRQFNGREKWSYKSDFVQSCLCFINGLVDFRNQVNLKLKKTPKTFILFWLVIGFIVIVIWPVLCLWKRQISLFISLTLRPEPLSQLNSRVDAWNSNFRELFQTFTVSFWIRNLNLGDSRL